MEERLNSWFKRKTTAAGAGPFEALSGAPKKQFGSPMNTDGHRCLAPDSVFESEIRRVEGRQRGAQFREFLFDAV